MVSSMRRKKILLCIALMGIIGITITYAHREIWWVKTFFVLPLTEPEAPIDELLRMIDKLQNEFPRTPAATDAKGNIYIVGRKNSKVRVLILNSKGKIERIITPCLKNGQFLRDCPVFSVSPSGNYIWTLSPIPSSLFTYRITVHHRNGKAITDWIVKGGSTSHWLLHAYSDKGAYGISNENLLHFIIDCKKPQKTKIFYFPLFHNGKFWIAANFGLIIKYHPELKYHPGFENLWGKGTNHKNLWIVATWTPQEGVHLIKKVHKNRPMVWIHAIDQNRNFYEIQSKPMLEILLIILEKFTLKSEFLTELLQSCERYLSQRTRVIKIISLEGKILDIIILPIIIKKQRGERLEYGQIIKVNNKGIYLEVERISEPREYRIVCIMKRHRWQVWWEKLSLWWKRKENKK